MSILKLLKSNNFIFFVIALILMGFAVHSLGKRKNNMLDSMVGSPIDSDMSDDDMMSDYEDPAMDHGNPQGHVSRTNKIAPTAGARVVAQGGAHGGAQGGAQGGAHGGAHVPKPVTPLKMTDPSDLLPGDKSGVMGNSDLINAGRFISQQSEVLRNANLQIRSDPPVGKAATGPWNGTTIGPDRMRPQFELGGRGGMESVTGFSNNCPMWMSSSLDASNSAILPPKHSPVSTE